MDGVLRQYVGPQLADRLGADPGLAELGGTEQEVSVLFADLSGFTAFAEGRSATEVIDMLNAYWGAVVPFVVDGKAASSNGSPATRSWWCSMRWAISPTTPRGQSGLLSRSGTDPPTHGDRLTGRSSASG